MSQQSIIDRPKSTKKRAAKPAAKSAVKIPAPESILTPASSASVEAAVAKAKIEQQNNAAYRALLEANERLVQQVFDLASLYAAEESKPAGDANAVVSAATAAAIKDGAPATANLADLPLSKLRCYHKSPEYKRRRDDIMQRLVGMYTEFGGKLNAAECGKLLGCSVTTIYTYASTIRSIRRRSAESTSAN